jgi:hypothetical protein
MSSIEQMNLVWRVSSKSNAGNCVEVAKDKTAIFVRDTKARGRGTLAFPSPAWEDFIKTIQMESIKLG